MPYGYNGKIVHINLTKKETTIEEKKGSWYRKYLGGRGIGAYYLLKELKSGIDPLKKENLLIFAVSVVTGVPFPGNARASVMSKSPLTGGFGESESGGNWGPELKKTGYDALIIRGKSDNPIYLYINDGRVLIKDASHIWGKTTTETMDIIKEELKDEKIKIASIGPAGEKGVLYACIIGGPYDVFGRMGMGAVMGSKNLKAIAVKGTKKPDIKDYKKIKEINKIFIQNFNKPETCGLFHDLGTAGAVNIYLNMGALPSFNFKKGVIKDGEKLSGEKMKEDGLMVGRTSCYACPIACRKTAVVNDPEHLNTNGKTHSPEYETIGALGSNCGINDPKIVIKANQLCNEFGIDTISTGVTISMAMEAVSKGLLPKDVLGKIPLEFGNGKALLKCIKLITERKGIGKVLSRGTKYLANKIGPKAKDLAMQGKGQEIAMQDPRGNKAGAAIGYAVAHNGGDHIQMEHDYQFSIRSSYLKSMEPLGITNPVQSRDLGLEKVRLFILNQKIWSLYNMLDICIFVAAPGHVMSLFDIRDIVKAATGWETSLYELMEAGERGIVMARMFNIREGFSSKDDVIPKRFNEELQNGFASHSKIDLAELKKAVYYYYELMNWDSKTGIPRKGKLLSLGLEWLT